MSSLGMCHLLLGTRLVSCECGGGQDPTGDPSSTDLPQLGEQLEGVFLCWEMPLVAPTQRSSRTCHQQHVVASLGFCPFLVFLSPCPRPKGHC